MSNANSVALRIAEEWQEGGAGTYGVIAGGGAGNATFADMRFTSESLKSAPTFETSDEITATGQVTDLIRTDNEGSGAIEGEFSYGSRENLYESVLLSDDWGAAGSNTGIGISFAASGNTVSDTGNGFTVANGFVVNEWVRITGAATAANNGIFKVLTRANGAITVAGGSLSNETAGASVVVTTGGEIANGQILRSHSIEKEYTDLTSIFSNYLGMIATGWTFTMPTQGKITESFSFAGQQENNGGTTIGDGSPTAIGTDEVMTGASSFSKFMEAGGTGYNTPIDIVSMSMSVNPNVRLRKKAGTTGPSLDPGRGLFVASGTIEMYFNDNDLATKFLGNTLTAAAFAFQDSTGKGYMMEFPNIKFSELDRSTPGQSEDVFLNVSFTAIRDPSELVTMRMQRFGQS